MTTDLITLRRNILESGEKTLARLLHRSNDHLPGIEAMRARAAAGVDHATKQLGAALAGTYRAA